MTKLIISGASNTIGPWPTWADLVCDRYEGTAYNVAVKGLGNEAIITRALHEAERVKDIDGETLILVMLTTIDKWDWYVDDPVLLEKYSKEKHTISKLTEDAPGGFWGTGIWFPMEKAIYKENFYSQDYFMMRTLQMIAMFEQVCQVNNWGYQILLDSPIWSCLETDLMPNTVESSSNRLVDTKLNHWLFKSMHLDRIYAPGLIGYLHNNKLPWYSTKFGRHPGSLGHYKFSKEHVFPVLDCLLPIKKSLDEIESVATVMDRLWTP